MADTLNNLGVVCPTRGTWPAARPLLERALGIDEAAYGPDHPEVATALNNLGIVLGELGDPAGAAAAA